MKNDPQRIRCNNRSEKKCTPSIDQEKGGETPDQPDRQAKEFPKSASSLIVTSGAIGRSAVAREGANRNEADSPNEIKHAHKGLQTQPAGAPQRVAGQRG
jgi:hypothetical protein